MRKTVQILGILFVAGLFTLNLNTLGANQEIRDLCNWESGREVCSNDNCNGRCGAKQAESCWCLY